MTVELFYKQHKGWLTGWLFKRLGCSFDAEDLSQDTFVRVLRSAKPVSSVCEPHNYLITIARGLSVDLFRRRTLENQYLDVIATLPERSWPSEEENALILETLVEIDRMFDGLGSRVKQTFILSQIEGLTYSQIAQELSISVRTVNNYMTQAMTHCCLFRLSNQL
ncbi:MAG: sigma-70 family RNA polymerase sigma factor [Pseudomonadales bacterium]